MTVLSRVLGLRPAHPCRMVIQRAVEVPMADGVVLLADRYHPRDRPDAPLVLIRSPYGRGSANDLAAGLIVERGYQVLLQSLRGTGGSGGNFDGFTMHQPDGPSTVDWLRRQTWFPGMFATWGASYLGYAQWELAATPVPEWKAAVIQDAPSEFYHGFMYPGGAFALGNALAWVQLTETMFDSGGSLWRQLAGQLTGGRVLARAVDALPVREADHAVAGRRVRHFQQWITHETFDEYWAGMDHRANVANMPPLVHLSGGWHDFFLPGMLADHAALRATGRRVRLLIGPWGHGKGSLTRHYLREALATLDTAFTGADHLPPAPVALHLGGANRWVTHADWPPPHQPTTWYLHPHGGLRTEPAPESDPSTYHYDPADPTPSLGGTIVGLRPGPKDNRPLEARADVLTFTGPPLTEDLTVAGPVTATLHVRSSNACTDFSVRLCDVHPRGRSTNLCDGLLRLRPGDPAADEHGVRTVHIRLWPAGHVFRRGHRIRVQVASGAHPRHIRNPGTGEPLAETTTLRPAEQEILHDPGHPSAVVLPVAGGPDAQR
ncbi:CocE/NonD family hydrolase [Crossiella sp. CA-258035]|uniref:CocE/NonD family hydrolase n=1 Tax=Crossiella sp. CA-258035 TaxID=2981138 RepID=UPI0024BCB8AF|nr:CocE/NonD family hydrolase [Crossiella sp. CA-258035]WHT20257.1 CocE/NonD family hydrolase [Crossiella sp. CA-258035]